MTLSQTERLIKVLCAHGVSHFKDRDVEIRIEAPHLGAGIQIMPAKSPPAAAVVPIPPSAAAAPPTEMAIPHHVNEVAKLLKLDDNSLAETLFPAGEEPQVEVPEFQGGKAE